MVPSCCVASKRTVLTEPAPAHTDHLANFETLMAIASRDPLARLMLFAIPGLASSLVWCLYPTPGTICVSPYANMKNSKPSQAEQIGQVAVFGESQVGKTRFIEKVRLVPSCSPHTLTFGLQFAEDHHYMQAGIAPEVRSRMSIDNQECEATYMDFSSTTVRTADASFSADIFMRSLGSAAGIVLLYDITSLSSFEHITNKAYTYARMCNKYMGSEDRPNSCEYILVGNKIDLVKEAPERREVDKDMAEEWAQSQGIKHREVCSHDVEGPYEAARELIKSIKRMRERDGREEHARRRQQRRDGAGESTIRNKIGGFMDRMKSNA
jgi:hypothetical protein